MRLRHLRHGPAILLLALHMWLALHRTERVGLTYDEPAHIVGGLYQTLTGDFRFQPENGTLPQRVEALPWVLANIQLPDVDGPRWKEAAIWSLADDVMEQAGPRVSSLLFWSRFTTALAGAGILLCLYLWVTSALGIGAGLLTLALSATSPTLLAHTGLATSDTWGTLGMVAASLALWRVYHRLTPFRVAFAGVVAGGLALSKFNVVLLPAVALLLIGLRVCCKADLPWRLFVFKGRVGSWGRLLPLCGATLAAALVAGTVIWAGYGFRYRASIHEGTRFALNWDQLLVSYPHQIGVERLGSSPSAFRTSMRPGPIQGTIRWAREHRILPEAWLYGLAFVTYHSAARNSYLAGQHYEHGDPAYFPTALILKTTAPFGLAVLVGLAGFLILPYRTRKRVYRLAPALAIFSVVLVVAMLSSVNIGLRHILPAVAMLGIAAAPLARLPGKLRKFGVAFGITSGVWQTLIAVEIAPHHLTYFNSLARPSPDYWLVDSNLDWGQGLPELKHWLETQKPAEPVYLSYFGSDAPQRYGLNLPRVADFHSDPLPRQIPFRFEAGWYCIGPTQFRRAYGKLRGPWTAGREALYQQVLTLRSEVANGSRSLSEEAFRLLAMDYELLSFGRLCAHLETRRPEVRLPGGMMLFHVTQQEIASALWAPIAPAN